MLQRLGLACLCLLHGASALLRVRGCDVRLETPSTLVLRKPAGVSTELSYATPGRDAALERAQDALGPGVRAGLPHRLDRGTEGLLVIALGEESLRRHNACVEERLWRKLYVARLGVEGNSAAAAAACERVLGPQKVYLKRKGKRALSVRSGGKVSLLHVAAAAVSGEIERNLWAVDVALWLHTGRYHQIRATMASLGAPLLGDRLYGGRGSEKDFALAHELLLLPVPDGDGAALAPWVLVRNSRTPALAAEVLAHVDGAEASIRGNLEEGGADAPIEAVLRGVAGALS